MATIRNFEELGIWKDAKILFEKIVELTNREIGRNSFRFKTNICEAAGSVMDNIAEGFERDSTYENINHLSFSKGSTGECRSQCIRGAIYGFWTAEEARIINEQYKCLSKDIANYIQYLSRCNFRGQKFKNRPQYKGNQNSQKEE